MTPVGFAVLPDVDGHHPAFTLGLTNYGANKITKIIEKCHPLGTNLWSRNPKKLVHTPCLKAHFSLTEKNLQGDLHFAFDTAENAPHTQTGQTEVDPGQNP